MMIACFWHLWNRLGPPPIAVALSALVLIPGAAAAAEELLAATPLILKDGRIANVSVHVLPFSAGGAELSSTTGRTLQGLTAEVATDCFLTAQVIGHVGASEVEGSDTLGAHRLARSRADAVQASLIDRGLPAKSIASVWDWQFMVLEPRATLWVFRLTEGEDCEGKPLEGAPAPVVASAERPEQRVTQPSAAPPPMPAARTSVAPTPAPSTSAASTSATPTPAPSMAALPTPVAPTPAASSAAIPTTPAAAPAMAAVERSDDAAKPRAVPAPAPATPEEAAERPPVRPAVQAAAASTARAPVVTESRPAVAPGEAAAAPVARVEPAGAEPRPQGVNALGSLSITFANNSSYFPPGTREQLESMVAKLPAGRYRVELVASVSGAASVVGASDAEEAARYNQWLANRRLDRVQSWFEVNVKDKDLIIQPEFKSGDDSRGVLVRISAAQTS